MFNLIMLINLKARSIWLTHDPLFQSIGNIYITASFGVPHVSKGWGARGGRRSSSKWLRCRAFGEGKGTRKGHFFGQISPCMSKGKCQMLVTGMKNLPSDMY